MHANYNSLPCQRGSGASGLTMPIIKGYSRVSGGRLVVEVVRESEPAQPAVNDTRRRERRTKTRQPQGRVRRTRVPASIFADQTIAERDRTGWLRRQDSNATKGDCPRNGGKRSPWCSAQPERPGLPSPAVGLRHGRLYRGDRPDRRLPSIRRCNRNSGPDYRGQDYSMLHGQIHSSRWPVKFKSSWKMLMKFR